MIVGGGQHSELSCQKLASDFSQNGTIRHQRTFGKDESRSCFGARLLGIFPKMESGFWGQKRIAGDELEVLKFKKSSG